MQNGISVIIIVRNAGRRLEKLLSSFLAINTHAPVELIVLDQDSTDSTPEVLAGFSHRECIRHIPRRINCSPASLANEGAGKARYPFLFFAVNNIIFNKDALPRALQIIRQDEDTGAVSAAPAAWDQQPVLQDNIWTGRSAGFLLCLKSDFEKISGFSREAYDLFSDFCLRLEKELQKKCRTLNDQACISRQIPDRISLRYFPDYSGSNPYQRLLYQTFPGHFQIRSGSLDEILEEMHAEQACTGYVFHLHWTNPVLKDANSPEQAREQMDRFLEKLEIFLEMEGILVWTIHNIVPHEMRYPELEKELCRKLAGIAHVVHVHSALVPELARPVYDISLPRTVVAHHGNYINVYPLDRSRDQARAALGIPVDAPVFLFLGRIRPYKGLPKLQEAFSSCLEKYPEARLILAGMVKGSEIKALEELFSGSRQVHLYTGFIPDQDIGLYLQAADYMVLPYNQVLTSGSVILAQSFGVPPIVPNLGLLKEHVRDGHSGYIYDPGKKDELAQAMNKALNNHKNYANLSRGALESARSLSWQHSAAMIAARIGSQILMAP